MAERLDIEVRRSGDKEAAQGIYGIGTAATQTEKKVEHLNQTMSFMKAAVAGFVGGLASQLDIGRIFNFADSFTSMQNQLRFVVADMKELTDVQEKLFEISQQTTTSFQDNVNIYAQLSQGAQQYGVSAQEMLNVTETLAMALNATGKGSAEAQGAINALAKSFANGEVSGRAMIQIFQSLPIVTRAIADHLGVPINELKRMAETGELTGKKIIEALQKSDLIIQASRDKVDTLADGWGNIVNAVQRYIGKANESTGVTQILVRAMILLADNMKTVLDVVVVLTAAWLTYRATLLLVAAAKGVLAIAAFGLAVAMGAISLATAPLALEIAAITAAFLAGVVAVAYFTGTLDQLMAKAKETASTLQETITKSLKEVAKSMGADFQEATKKFVSATNQAQLATTETGKAMDGLSQKQRQLNKSADLEMNIYQDKIANSQRDAKAFLQAMGNDVAAAAVQINEGWHHAADDPDAGLLAYRQRMNEAAAANREMMSALIRKHKEAAAEIGSSVDVMIKAYKKQQDAASEMSTLTVNAMGKVVQAQDGWAARSGQLYNEMSEDVKNYAEDTVTQTERIRSQYSKVTDSVTKAQEAVHNFAGVADPRFSGIPPGMSKILMEAGIDVGEFQKRLVAQSIHYGHPGGAGAQESLYRFFQGLTEDQSMLLQRLGLGYAQGTDFIVPGSGAPDSKVFAGAVSPGERITISTKAQQREEASSGRGAGTVNNIQMNIYTPDADSFRASQRQVISRLGNQLNQVRSRARRPV